MIHLERWRGQQVEVLAIPQIVGNVFFVPPLVPQSSSLGLHLHIIHGTDTVNVPHWLYSGAKGKTAEELKLLIPFLSSDNDTNFQEYIQEDRNNIRSNALIYGNSLFVTNAVNILSAYEQKIRKIFNTEVVKVNLGDSSQAVSEINEWVAKQTDINIREIIEGASEDVKVMLKSELLFADLAVRKIHAIFESSSMMEINLKLPKLKFEYNANLKRMLQSVGINELESANLKSMSDFGSLLYFNVNHSFVFYIKDNKRIYFAGNVYNPF
ncbi:alpha-1-antitrypsin-like [Drosophila innubila]|uniref:alpha-1-antitrypsin-like n=1 Tax=Drosophila innubila TaxID=198719 RepID=UPI00148B6249|nr:alpha-1-antitrypsin-like [Drosophila innubila]